MSDTRLELLKDLRKELRAYRANERRDRLFLPVAFGEKVRYAAWPYFQNKYFRFLDKWFFQTVVHFIELHISHFVHYIPYTCLALAFIYDLYHQQFYTIQFAGLFVVITTFIAKIRYFLYVKDCVHDSILNAYFYKNKIPYKEIRKTLFGKACRISVIITNRMIIGEEGDTAVLYMSEISNYMAHDFKVYYFIDKLRVAGFNYRRNQAKRLSILFILLLGNIYYIYNYTKYSIIIWNSITLSPVLLLIPLWVLTCLEHKKILYLFTEKPFEMREHKKNKRLYLVLWLIQGSIMLYILLKNKMTLFPMESIYEGSFIQIIEAFSYDEKVAYIKKYLDFVATITAPNKDYWIEVFTNMDIVTLINTDLSMEGIRDNIKAQIEDYLKGDKTEEEVQEVTSMYSKFKEKVISLFTKK
jgi:hypothetical protein